MLCRVDYSKYVLAFFSSVSAAFLPQISVADTIAAASLKQCKMEIQRDSSAQTTAEICLNAETKIQASAPNSKEHVAILEQLALITGYNKNLNKTAEYYYNKALEVARFGFGKDSAETIEPLKNLAALASISNDWKSARELSLQAIGSIRKQQPDVLDKREKSSLDTITMTYRVEKRSSPQTYRLEDHLQAEKNLLGALRKMNLTERFEKQEIGVALLEIGKLEMDMGLLDQATKTTEEAHASLMESQSGNWITRAENQLEKIAAMK